MNDAIRLLKYVRPYWFTFVLALFAMLLGAAFETAIGALLVPIFDQFWKSPAVAETSGISAASSALDWPRSIRP